MNRDILLFIILITGPMCLGCGRLEQKYNENWAEIIDNKASFSYDLIFDHYFENNQQFPQSYQDLDSLLKDWPIFAADFAKFVDPFSKSGDTLSYLPLYERNSNRILGYALYSAGIDGKINNQFKLDETVFLDEVESKLRMYNYYPPKCRVINTDTLEFKLVNFLFGTKDLLISNINCEKVNSIPR